MDGLFPFEFAFRPWNAAIAPQGGPGRWRELPARVMKSVGFKRIASTPWGSYDKNIKSLLQQGSMTPLRSSVKYLPRWCNYDAPSFCILIADRVPPRKPASCPSLRPVEPNELGCLRIGRIDRSRCLALGVSSCRLDKVPCRNRWPSGICLYQSRSASPINTRHRSAGLVAR